MIDFGTFVDGVKPALDTNHVCPHWKIHCNWFNSFLWAGGSVYKFLWPRQGLTCGSGEAGLLESSIHFYSLGAVVKPGAVSLGSETCLIKNSCPRRSSGGIYFIQRRIQSAEAFCVLWFLEKWGLYAQDLQKWQDVHLLRQDKHMDPHSTLLHSLWKTTLSSGLIRVEWRAKKFLPC